MADQFKGDNQHLLRCIRSLLDIDESEALSSPLGGHARCLLEAASTRLNELEVEKASMAAEIDACVSVLPGTYYMDPPDGGDVSIPEQLHRMAKDAERFRWISSGVQQAETLTSIVICHGGYSDKVAERVDVYLRAEKEDLHG